VPYNLRCVVRIEYSSLSGFFICAVIEELRAVSTVMGGGHPTLSLAAGWTKEQGFTFLMHGNDLVIDFGDGVKSDPFELQVSLVPNPALRLACGVMVMVPNQSTPLHFLLDCTLEANATGAVTLAGSMNGYWENPFGLSQQLKVGNMKLSITMSLAAGFTPQGLGLAGEIQYSGKTKLAIALFVNADPTSQ
jgi:hypothetical protein